jgi:hypothetical protein
MVAWLPYCEVGRLLVLFDMEVTWQIYLTEETETDRLQFWLIYRGDMIEYYVTYNVDILTGFWYFTWRYDRRCRYLIMQIFHYFIMEIYREDCVTLH